MFYDDGIKLDTREDYLVFLEELKAYQELEGEDFKFKDTLVKNTGEFEHGSESAHLKMDIQQVEEKLAYLDYLDERELTSQKSNYYKSKSRAITLRNARKHKSKLKNASNNSHKYYNRNLKEIKKRKAKAKNLQFRYKKYISSSSRGIYKQI